MAKEKEKDFSRIVVKDEDGNRYTLEFSRKSVEVMEKAGFRLDTDKPNTMINDLFYGAFRVNHRGLTQDRAREIWAAQKDKEGLLAALTKLYMKPLENLMAEPEEEGDGNPTWETE